MEGIHYEPLIRDMTWSYSRIRSFEDCPYRWYLRYIRGLQGKRLFFSDYGSFVHKILWMYYTGQVRADQIPVLYMTQYRENVITTAPSEKVFLSYFQSGLQYFRDFHPLPYKLLSAEQKVELPLWGTRFSGVIDFLGEEDGELVIVDHKSRALRPRSRRQRPTKKDAELDRYLTQLYLYAEAVRQLYGKYPAKLCFNCFREPALIEEPFDPKALERSRVWLQDGVETIAKEEEFRPDIEWFKCSYLCELRDECEYFAMSDRGRKS